MAVRKCPACLTTASMGTAVAFTNDFVCAGCGQHLEVTEASRVLASAVGIIAGYLAVHYFALPLAESSDSTLYKALPVLYGLLAYGAVSAFMLMFTADLRIIPAPSTPATTEAASPHSGHH